MREGHTTPHAAFLRDVFRGTILASLNRFASRRQSNV